MLRSPQDLYARLLSSTYGYPLWTPEPTNEFLIERPEGLRIGDVGVVIPDNGGFDALFNLCLPRNHRFHTRYGVPDSFTCIRPEELEIGTLPSAEPHGEVILTPSVTRLGTAHSSTEAPQRDGSGVSTYRFNLSSDEGALLILPEGAERHELLNDGLFVEKASQNGAEWYNYAVNRRRRIISQDALYVITGLYKTRSWSVAAFEDVAGNESYTAHYKHVSNRSSTTPTYSWETTRASLRSRAGTSIDFVTPSQTIFIRGLKIALRNGFLGSKWVSVEADIPSKARSNPVKSLSVVPSNSWVRDGLASLMRWEGGSISRATTHTGRPTNTAEEQEQSNVSDQGEYEGAHVVIQRVPSVPPAFHPSNAINQYLLRKDPSANIAITCDSIWMSMLENKSLMTEELDQGGRLEKVLSENYHVFSHEGVVRLERKREALVDRQAPSRGSTASISDPNSALGHVSQVSAPMNPKDADKRELLMNEGEVGVESHINSAEYQPITSRISLLNEQPLSPSSRIVFDMPNVTPDSPFPNLVNFGVGEDGFPPGSHLQRSLSPIPTEFCDSASDPPHNDLSSSTYATHDSLASPLGQVPWGEELQNILVNPTAGASSSYLGDNVRQVSTEQPLSLANQSIYVCQWENQDGIVCGQAISAATLSKHLINVHKVKSKPYTVCGWYGCERKFIRSSITSHVLQMHLGKPELEWR